MRFSLASLLVECCCAGISPSEKSQSFRWCSGRWCQVWRGRGVLFLALKMSQNSIDDVLIFDASDDSDRTAAAAADFDVYVEYSLESLSPSHGGVALGGRADFCVGDRHDAFPAPGWCDKSAPAVVWSENAMVASEIDSRFWHQGGQPRNEIHRLEGHLCRPIPVRRLQGVNHLARGT